VESQRQTGRLRVGREVHYLQLEDQSWWVLVQWVTRLLLKGWAEATLWPDEVQDSIALAESASRHDAEQAALLGV
jgi:hypothetical protein